MTFLTGRFLEVYSIHRAFSQSVRELNNRQISKMLPTLFLIFFFGLSTAAAQVSLQLKTSQIKATGFPAGDPSLERLRYNCCKGKKGVLSGLCLPEPGNTMSTIEITFDFPTKVTEVDIQEPDDPKYGFTQFVFISYKRDSSDPKPTEFQKGPDKKLFALKPINITNVPNVKTLYIHIGKGGYYNKPCLRLKIMGFEQKDFPIMDGAPKLTTTTDKVDNTVTFYCTATQRKGFRHTAQWFIDGKKVPTNKIQSSTVALVSKIHQRDLHKLPARQGIKCSVTICNDANCARTTSKARDSNLLTPTATVSPKKLALVEGKAGKKITIKFNGPPVLFLDQTYVNKHGTKHIRLEAEFPANSRKYTCSKVAAVVQQDHAKNRECGPLVTDWKSPQNIDVKAVTDGLYIKSTIKRKCNVYLRHYIQDAGKMKKVFEKILETVDVDVTNRDGWDAQGRRFSGVCSSYNDPHLTTFDRLRFEGQSQGEFIAYLKGDYQVNGFFVNCGKIIGRYFGATCNCGVAVKAGDEVVVLSSCPKVASTFELNNPKGLKKRPDVFKVYTFLNGAKRLNGKFRSGMRVYSNNKGREYYVTLPTGTYVKVTYSHRGPMINFIVIPSLSDWETSTGFCGHYDGSTTNDQRNRDGSVYRGHRNRFVEVWREKSCSLFHGAKPHKPISRKSYCRCVPNSHTYDCGEDFDADPCPPKGAKEETAEIIDKFSYPPGPNACSPRPTKGRRSVDNQLENLDRMKRAVPADPKDEDDVYRSFVFNASFVYQEPTWPTDSGWTEEKARSYCEDYIIKKDAVQKCKTYQKKSYTDEINSCIFDIKASDSTTFAESTLNVIIADCLAEVEKEPPNVEDLSGGLNKTVLLSSLCLDDCNGNGTCEEGQCVCNDGYYGSVCSLTKDTPPTISYIPRDGLCNMRSRNCSRSEVFGKDIIKSPDLKCRLTPYDPVKKVRDDSGQFMTSATYVNFNLVLCPHDGNYGNFLIALSNNGKDYSNDELLFMAYDSACFKCTIDQDEMEGNCTQVKTGCLIESKCYLPEEFDANSHCRICDPDRNINNWSLNTEPSNCTHTEPEEDNMVAIIAGVSSGVALIIIIVIAVVVHKKCRRRGKSTPPSAMEVKYEANGNDPQKEQETPKRGNELHMDL